ncbi:MAG: PIN domain-containing protein [Selenomonadaceae bacterium]|nr:PIN domain-containing protein [Selenomonadaceae bacterium]
MRFLVDVNILLDVLMNRQPHVTDSASIWKLCETGQAEGYISSLTFANLIYIMRKEINPKGIEIILDKLSLIFHFADLTSSDLISAAKLQWNDFEDAVQCVTAKRLNADYIITRNVKDFKESDIIAITPTNMLKLINDFSELSN